MSDKDKAELKELLSRVAVWGDMTAREVAVVAVDTKRGYTYEHCSSPSEHRSEYDRVEALILAWRAEGSPAL